MPSILAIKGCQWVTPYKKNREISTRAVWACVVSLPSMVMSMDIVTDTVIDVTH